MLRSKYNQSLLDEIRVCQLGQGQVFGEDDCHHKRNYTYTLRAQTTNAECYIIKRDEFIQQITHSSCRDEITNELIPNASVRLINKLAASVVALLDSK